MVSGVVLDQEHLLSAIPLRQAIQKGGVALAFKHLSKSVIELGAVQIHRPENLAGVPLPRRRNQRLLSPCPRRAHVWYKLGSWRKLASSAKSRAAWRSAVFLAGDTCSAASDPARPGRPRPTGVGDVARKSPSP